MHDEQAKWRAILWSLDSLAHALLPGPDAPDGVLPDTVVVLSSDALEIRGRMWWLGNASSWCEPLFVSIHLYPGTDKVEAYKVAVADAARGFVPERSRREERREWTAPKERLFVIEGPRRSGHIA